MTERLHFHFSLSCFGEGNGNPLQCSCLENPRDGGAWWAAVSGVTQSRTRLKRLSSSSSRQKPSDLLAITEGEEAQITVNLSFYLSALVSAGQMESEGPRRAEFWAVQFEKGYRKELVFLCCLPHRGGPLHSALRLPALSSQPLPTSLTPAAT